MSYGPRQYRDGSINYGFKQILIRIDVQISIIGYNDKRISRILLLAIIIYMNTSTVLAQILGILFIALGLSMIFNKKWTALAIEEITKNQGLVWLAGFITLILGTTIVTLNNTWTSGVPLLVTILGWLTLIKGAAILVFPDFTFSYYKKMNKENIFTWGGVIIFILGLLLFF
jgi:hypothetical protein